MAILAVIGILYGAVVAAMQRDMKRLIAFVDQPPRLIVLGIFALTNQGSAAVCSRW